MIANLTAEWAHVENVTLQWIGVSITHFDATPTWQNNPDRECLSACIPTVLLVNRPANSAQQQWK